MLHFVKGRLTRRRGHGGAN